MMLKSTRQYSTKAGLHASSWLSRMVITSVVLVCLSYSIFGNVPVGNRQYHMPVRGTLNHQFNTLAPVNNNTEPSSNNSEHHISDPERHILFRPHYFGGKGNDFDQVYVPMSLRAVMKFNPKAHVHFIHNCPEFALDDEPQYHGYLMQDFVTPESESFNESYVHLSTNHYSFEKYAIMGYFYIKELMKQLSLSETIVVETDVLVFTDLWSTLISEFPDLNHMSTNGTTTAADAILTKRQVLGSSYVNSLFLETYTNVALSFYKNASVLHSLRAIKQRMEDKSQPGGINDMTISTYIWGAQFNGMFNNMNSDKRTVKVDELSVVLPLSNSFFDTNLKEYKYKFGEFETILSAEGYNGTFAGIMKKVTNINGAPYMTLKNTTEHIRLNSIHFGGGYKKLIPNFYNKFVISTP